MQCPIGFSAHVLLSGTSKLEKEVIGRNDNNYEDSGFLLYLR